MPSERNQRVLEELIASLSRCTIAITTNYSGLPVPALNELRRRLREQGVEYKVAKNTLTILAGRATEKEGIEQVLEGPTGIAYGYGDPTVPAKALDEYIRATRSTMTIGGAVMGGRVLSREEVLQLASLPSQEVLLSQLVGQIQAPISNLAAVLRAPLQQLVTVLQRRLEQEQPTPSPG